MCLSSRRLPLEGMPRLHPQLLEEKLSRYICMVYLIILNSTDRYPTVYSALRTCSSAIIKLCVVCMLYITVLTTCSALSVSDNCLTQDMLSRVCAQSGQPYSYTVYSSIRVSLDNLSGALLLCYIGPYQSLWH